MVIHTLMGYAFYYDIKRNIFLMTQKYFFIFTNIILGSFLLFTYYRGVTSNPEIAPKLWGGVPPYLINYILGFMFIGAIGYFFFTYYFIFRINHNTVLFFNQFSFSFIIILYLLILIPSCFWIDLSVLYIKNGDPLLWRVIVGILYIVGISSIILLISLLNINPGNNSIGYKLAVYGCACFAVHTMFLDGLLWTIFFHK